MSRILIVDDDVDTCLNMADLCGDSGYAIGMGECGATALVKAGRRRLDRLDYGCRAWMA